MSSEQEDKAVSFAELKAATTVFLGRLEYISTHVCYKHLPPRHHKMVRKLRRTLLDLAEMFLDRLILDDLIRFEALLQSNLDKLRAERAEIEKMLFNRLGVRKARKKSVAEHPTSHKG